jgi:hypothetical protein
MDHGYALASNMEVTRKLIAATGFAHGALDAERFYVVPAGVGGIIVSSRRKAPGSNLAPRLKRREQSPQSSRNSKSTKLSSFPL